MGFDLLAWRTIVLLLAASFAWSMAGLSEAFADWDEPADLPGMEDTSHDTTVIVLATLVVAVAVFWWVKKSGKDDQEEKSDKGFRERASGQWLFIVGQLHESGNPHFGGPASSIRGGDNAAA